MRKIALLGVVFALSACAGSSRGFPGTAPANSSGSVSAAATSTPQPSAQSGARASGTLTLVIPKAKSAARSRKPAYVSPSTTDATLFIDGSTSGFRAEAAERAIELDPAHSAAAYSRALATLNLGNEIEAARLFGLVPSTDRKIFGSAMAARAHLLEEHGDIEGVVATLTRWLEVCKRQSFRTTGP